jgi:hypothetical protein
MKNETLTTKLKGDCACEKLQRGNGEVGASAPCSDLLHNSIESSVLSLVAALNSFCQTPMQSTIVCDRLAQDQASY